MESLNRDAPVVQRASLGALWGGQGVEASFVPPKKNTHFFLVFGFCSFFFVLVTLFRFSRLVTTTFLLPAWLTAAALHQIWNPSAPYPYPPPCTSSVVVERCLRPQNPSLHSNKPFVFLPLATATVGLKALEASIAPGFVVQVHPHSPYTHALQLL